MGESQTAVAAPVASNEEVMPTDSPTRERSVATRLGHEQLGQRLTAKHLHAMTDSQLDIVAHFTGKDEQVKRRLKWLAAFCMVFALVVVALNTGTTAAMIHVLKDLHVHRSGLHPTASDGRGNIVLTGTATYDLPLFVAPVIPEEELFNVDKIRVTLPNSEFEEEDAVNSFRITRVEKVNSTVVIFYALGGEQIRVVNGDTAVRMWGGTDDGADDIPVCEGNITCAAFEVDSSTLAEKYIAEAEASLQTAGYTLEASLDSSAEVRQLRPKRRACRRYVYYLSRSRG